jgi:hypothetical protein
MHSSIAPPNESGSKPAFSPEHGRLPRFPCQLFIHCVASLPGYRQLAEHVPGVDKYAERAMLLARANDFVCLAHRVSPAYLDFLNLLDLGPDPAHIIRLPDAAIEQAAVPLARRLQHYLSSGARLPKVLENSQEVWLNCFAASELDTQLRSRLATLFEQPVLAINRHPGKRFNLYDKSVVRQQAHALGLPLPPGESVTLDRRATTTISLTMPLRRAIDTFVGITGRVIVRGAMGASGSSVFVVSSDKGEVRQCLHSVSQQGHTNVFLVEPFYDVDVSPNIGMFIDPRDRAISCISVNDQIMDGKIRHLGNRFPSQARLADQMVAAATRYCRWLRDQGTTGFLGFDFCEYRVAGSTERQFFFAEMNPRFNGATYPVHLLARLNAQVGCENTPRWREFMALTMQTSLKSFSALQSLHGDLLFNGRAAAGIIPYNVGLLQHGKLMLTVVGETSGDVEAIHDEFCHRSGDRKVRIRGFRRQKTAA